MPHERLRPTFAFTAERVEELRRVVPEAFADGKMNWSALREALGDWAEDEAENAEHFGLTWPGKRDARRMAALPSQGTLMPVPGEGVDEETTRNIFIEVDNLEVLKLLQKSYSGSVKLIYIDPPYNTGNDLVYEDDFAEPLEAYLGRTGQLDEEAKASSTNTRSDGRFHSKWLSMIYPRLRLARSLLQRDGFIFVSIDDNEVSNLRLILNEIFGEECFVATVVWQKRTSPDARLNLSAAHDYIVVYAKDSSFGASALQKLPLSDEREKAYKNPDNDPRGPWASVDLTGQTGHATASQFYTVKTPGGRQYPPPEGRCWALAEKTFKELRAEGRIWFGADGNSRPRLKKFLSESEGTTTWTWWANTDVGSNQDGTKELVELLGQGDIFTNPKPTRLLQRVIALGTKPGGDDLCLDFFAGSGSFAQAVWQENLRDGGNRHHISVQLPERTAVGSPARSAGYETISKIAIDRLRRASKKLRLGTGDFGLKVLRLEPSSFRPWLDYEGDNIAKLQDLFTQSEQPLREHWTPGGLLTEIMLMEGFPLNSQIETTPVGMNAVNRITSAAVPHSLIVCLDPHIDMRTALGLHLSSEDVVVCLDSALSDQGKLGLADRCLLKTI